MKFFHTVCPWLLQQLNDIYDAFKTEFCVLSGNSHERGGFPRFQDNNHSNAEASEKIQRMHARYDKNANMLCPLPQQPEKRKRISDISQMRLDAYVARTEEQAVKQRRLQKA